MATSPDEVDFAQFLSIGISFMVVAGVLLVVFLFTYQKHLLQQQLRLRTIEASHRQELLTAVIDAQESERARIGQELHDGIGSTVASAKLLFSRMRHLADTMPPEQAALLETLMATAVQDVRSISHNLYPSVLAHYGLAEAIQYLADVCNETGPLAVEIAIQYDRPLSLEQELALYRICQELVHNAQKHAAGATCLHIALHQTETHLTLSVADDGCGFTDSPTPAATRGAGLRSIDLRTQLLGATLRRETAVGQGICTTIQLARST